MAKLKILSQPGDRAQQQDYHAHSKNVAEIVSQTLTSRCGLMPIRAMRAPLGNDDPPEPTEEQMFDQAMKHCQRDIVAGVNLYFLLTGARTTEIEVDERSIGLTPNNRGET